MPLPGPGTKLVTIPLTGPLDESNYPGRMPRSRLQQAQNVVYRRVGALGKRTGSGPAGNNGILPSGAGGISGYRWYRGEPSALRAMFVQSADQLFKYNDATGAFAALTPGLSIGSSPAFFASAYDPALSSDIMIVAYGSGPPMRYDGTTFTQLNASITNHFSGVHTWHDHVWFWGDNPGTVYATDLFTPESMTFCLSFGGYQIGRGDGDPSVQRIISQGDRLFVFKSHSIYTITGYDFSTGEYQFSVQPFTHSVGIPSAKCVALLPSGSLIFWSGENFYIIEQGSDAAVPIGTPLLKTMGIACAGNQNVVRTTAGSFLVQGVQGNTAFNDVFLCALDDGSGSARTIVVYDEYASAQLGMPAWTIWTGLTIGAFIPWMGPGDLSLLYFADSTSSQVSQLGKNPSNDNGNAINVAVTTIRDDTGTPDQQKTARRIYLECESGKALFNVNVTSDKGLTSTQSTSVTAPNAGGVFGTAIFGTDVFGAKVQTVYQTPVSAVEPELRGGNFTYQLLESSTDSVYELLSLTTSYTESALVTQ